MQRSDHRRLWVGYGATFQRASVLIMVAGDRLGLPVSGSGVQAQVLRGVSRKTLHQSVIA